MKKQKKSRFIAAVLAAVLSFSALPVQQTIRTSAQH